MNFLLIVIVALLSFSTSTVFGTDIDSRGPWYWDLREIYDEQEILLDDLQTENYHLQKNLLDLRSQLLLARNQISDLQNQTTGLNEETLELDSQISTRDDQIADLYTKTYRLESELYNIIYDFSDFKQWITDIVYALSNTVPPEPEPEPEPKQQHIPWSTTEGPCSDDPEDMSCF